MKATILDRVISHFAPTRGVERVAARARIAAFDRMAARDAAPAMHYDGASRSYRTVGRRIDSASANTEIARGLWRLRDVSRDLARNNPYAVNAVEVITSNVVGAGIVPSVVAAKRMKARINGLIADHLDTPAIDFDGRNNLYGLQSLVTRMMVEAGEALIVRYVAPPALGLPVPLQVRVLEPEYLDVFKTGPVGGTGNVCFEGIEFDKDGRRVGYWLFDEHPGGGPSWRLPVSKRVEARDVIHVFRVDRAGQVRGIPWGAPVVMTLWDLADYEDAELMRQKIAACFAVFFTGGQGQNLADKQLSEKTLTGTPVDRLEPGLMQSLGVGQDVKFATPPTVASYEAYLRANVRKVSVGYGVPYEWLANDMSQVSFISGRLGLLQFGRRTDQWRWHIVIPHMCAGIGQWFLEAAGIVVGARTSEVRLKWTPPRKEYVEPVKEVLAARDAIRAGLSSRSEEQRKSGHDPEELDAENSADNKRADELKNVKFDSDGRFPITAMLGDTPNDGTNSEGANNGAAAGK